MLKIHILLEDSIVGTEEPSMNNISTKHTGYVDEQYLYLHAILSSKMIYIESLLFMFLDSRVYLVYLYSRLLLNMTVICLLLLCA